MIQSTAGYVQIDAMFIDEGFGSLDEESRMRAIRILQELAGGKRLIGIISHVQELKDQIDRKMIVKKDEKGSHVYWQEEERRRNPAAEKTCGGENLRFSTGNWTCVQFRMNIMPPFRRRRKRKVWTEFYTERHITTNTCPMTGWIRISP